MPFKMLRERLPMLSAMTSTSSAPRCVAINAASGLSDTTLQSRATRPGLFEPFRCPGPAPSTIPFPLPRGRQIVTLKDAANYIQKLPKAEQDLEEWQAAVEALLLVVELNGPTMMARIGIMRALNRNVERTFNSSRKDTHWGRRKLKRDTA
jgi:hypothetical protein